MNTPRLATLETPIIRAAFALLCATMMTCAEDPMPGDQRPFIPAPHPSLAPIPNDGGPVLAAPRLTTITFSDTRFADEVEAFGEWIVGSSWLAAATEYGVGRGTYAQKVRLPRPAPAKADRAFWFALIPDLLEDGTLAPPPQGEVPLYVIVVPPTTVVPDPIDGKNRLCRDLAGFHGSSQAIAGPFAYAVVAECPSSATQPGFDDLAAVEKTMSHEIIEAATNPLGAIGASAWHSTASDSDPTALIDGEVADRCDFERLLVEGHRLARYWSNAAASAGLDPCVPAPADAISFGVFTDGATVVRAAPGTSVVFDYRAWSTAKKDWFVGAVAVAGAVPPGLHLDPGGWVTNGDEGRLVVDIPAETPLGQDTVVALVSADSRDVHAWYVAVHVE